MDSAEFDRFADEYTAMHQSSIAASGEEVGFFAEYKVLDIRVQWDRAHPGREPAAILDFGGGIGGSAPYLRRHFPQARIALADVSARSLDIARRRGIASLDCIHFDGARLPIEGASIDLALAACVFHHIPAPEHVDLLAEIRRVLKPGGCLYLFEHNPWNPLTRRAVKDCPFDEHAMLIAAPAMRRRFAEAGYERLALAYRIFFPRVLRMLRPFEPQLARLPLGAQYRVTGVRPA